MEHGKWHDACVRVPRLEDSHLARLVDEFARHDAWCHLAVPEDLRAELHAAATDKALAIARLLVHARAVGLLEPAPPREIAPDPVAVVAPLGSAPHGPTPAPRAADAPLDPHAPTGGPPPAEELPAAAAPEALPPPPAVVAAPLAPVVLAPPPPAALPPEPALEAEELTEDLTEDRIRPPDAPPPAPPSARALDQLLSKFKQGPDWTQPAPLYAARGLADILEALGPPEPDEPLDALLAEYRRREAWSGLDGTVAALLTELFVARLRAIQARGADPRVDDCIKGIRWWAKDRANRFVRGLRLVDGPRLASWHLDAQAYWRDLVAMAAVGTEERSARRRPATIVSVATPVPEDTLLRVVEQCAETCGNLLFLPSALASAKDSPYRNPETVRSALLALDEVAGRWATSLERGGMGASWYDALREHRLEYKSRISETTRGQYGEEYTFLYEGEKVLFHEHVTIGKKQADRCLSIHFHRDTKTRRVVVGHVGRHLSNTLS